MRRGSVRSESVTVLANRPACRASKKKKMADLIRTKKACDLRHVTRRLSAPGLARKEAGRRQG